MPPLNFPSLGRGRLCRLLAGTAAALAVWSGASQFLQAQNADSAEGIILTNVYQVWAVPRDERTVPHRIRTEIGIYYFDPEWQVAWGESYGLPVYLHVADSPTRMNPGERLLLDGWVLPGEERILWDRTRVTVLESNVTFKTTSLQSLNDRSQQIANHRIVISGLLDNLVDESTHATANFIANGTVATAFIMKDPNATLPLHAGDLIRMTAVYAPRFDRDANVSAVDLWVARPEDIEVTGSLDTDPKFKLAATPAQGITDLTPTNLLLRVSGIVRTHESGGWVTIWDSTGQVMVQSKQTLALRIGDHVEAIGYPFVAGVQQCLRGGMYRLAGAGEKSDSTNDLSSPWLPLAARVRDLSREEAARHGQVKLRAIVTWSHPDTPFAYVQDASGGIRILNPTWVGKDAMKPGAIVTVDGQVGEGGYVPVVTNAVLTRAGWWTLEPGQSMTLEQAMTGAQDGQWVQMRGFVRDVVATGGLIRMDLSTSSGEFEAWTPATQSYQEFKGSIIRVQGVCAATSNARHQLTGIQIWAPQFNDFTIEEPAPDDPFEAPMRSPANLRRYSFENSLNQRVRTFGTVVLQAPGRFLYVQDGADSVFALTQQHDLLHPGDRVEVVGFPGHEGRRFILREAAYRRVSAGQEPVPVDLPELHSANLDLAGLLTRGEGTILNMLRKDGETRLLVGSSDATFEASLDAVTSGAHTNEPDLEPGSRVAVTGVYEIQSDESGKPRSCLLHLRSWSDVTVLARPPWWTLARLGWALLGVVAVTVVVVAWGVLMSRKNLLLEQAQGELQAAHDKLELRVEERTRELREQVEAKERARAELSSAQERLIQTSRQAGMAEVATGVLHNVGNVLNSVNVSTALLAERLRGCRVESVSKAAALLHQPADRLGHFLTDDPKGRALPDYLQKLGDVLLQDKRDMQSEIESLTKNVDHIKVIVSMQQTYAKVAGVLEELDPRDLAEDAVQINRAALERHEVKLIRDYQASPRVMVDRHKALQILVNLVNNAKHALSEKVGDKIIKFTIAPADSGKVRLSVTDNGVGIAPENLHQIFSQGFTTRRDGHGFGLHSGANAAKELGGSLSVHSDGLGQGATFTLELPVASGNGNGNGNGAHKGNGNS